MITRAAGRDIPLIVDLGARFHAAAGERGTFDPVVFAETVRNILSGGAWFVSRRGMIGGLLARSAFDRRIIAHECFWYAEDGRGMDLLRAWLKWAENNADEVRMDYLPRMQGERVGPVLERLGMQRDNQGMRLCA